MPIQEQNIQFLRSQVMDDVPEGGGAATGFAIPDGVMNNVFEDISDLDRAYGRINLRKIFLGVRSLDTSLYGGAKSFIAAVPDDAALAYTLFSTNNAFDTRAQALARVEAYLYKGPTWHGVLLESHIAGMRAIHLLQRLNTVLPPIGKTLCLVQDEGLPGEIEQYVRITDLTVTATTFTDAQGDFTRWVIRCDLSDPLRATLNGHAPSRLDNYAYTGKTRVRDTMVADATQFYGTQPLALAATTGDRTLKAASLWAQLVPGASTEMSMVNQMMNPQLVQTLSGGARTVDVPQQAHTRARAVTAENRRLSWIETLKPRPGPATLSVAYRAQGAWYVLTADANGAISGADPAYGAGTLNPSTDTVDLTLGALPDAGSQILYTWASAVHYAERAGHADLDPAIAIRYSVGEPIQPGTLELSWLENGLVKTATGAVSGVISGDATGRVAHSIGEFTLAFTTPPDANSLLGIDYERVTRVQHIFTGVAAPGGVATLSLNTALEPGSVEVRWSTQSTTQSSSNVTVHAHNFESVWASFSYQETSSTTQARRHNHVSADNGAGEIIDAAGSVNYTTGALTLPLLPAIAESSWSTTTGSWSSTSGSALHTFATGVVTVWYTPASAASVVVSTEIAIPDLQFRILPRLLDETVVPNSVEWSWNGQTYRDFNGSIYRNNDTLLAGAINYASGIVTLSDYVSGSGTVTVTSLLTRFGEWSAVEACFRAALAPLAPEGLSILATAMDGEQLTGSADANGDLVSDTMRGTVNYEFGTASVEFGAGEPWIPRAVDPGTIRYNAIAYTYLPLSAAILGVDAVRLPADGRVPIFRAGYIVMIIHSLTTAPATPQLDPTFVIGYSNGVPITAARYAINVGRPRIGWAKTFDATGAVITSTYDVDRANGKVGWEDLTGLATPFTVRHTIGDLRLVVDAQIDGTLVLATGISHDFPADDSLVCACLIHGDRRARVAATWDQESWAETWVDYRVGSAATGTLNLIDFPMVVTNEGCDTDRWVMRWLSSTSVEIISENRGLIFTGTYTAEGDDLAPINPRTRVWDEQTQTWSGGVPYLTIPAAANGGGWSAGNVLRFNTVGALADFWIARAISPSDIPLDDGADGCELHALGNINRP